jgi:hypothetical protein
MALAFVAAPSGDALAFRADNRNLMASSGRSPKIGNIVVPFTVSSNAVTGDVEEPADCLLPGETTACSTALPRA